MEDIFFFFLHEAADVELVWPILWSSSIHCKETFDLVDFHTWQTMQIECQPF